MLPGPCLAGKMEQHWGHPWFGLRVKVRVRVRVRVRARLRARLRVRSRQSPQTKRRLRGWRVSCRLATGRHTPSPSSAHRSGGAFMSTAPKSALAARGPVMADCLRKSAPA